jgi:uncharacterized protein
MAAVILDSGPLIAYFHAQDPDHTSVLRWFEKQAAKHTLITTDAVITEVAYMLSASIPLQTAFLEWVSTEVQIEQMPPEKYPDITAWMRAYSNVPMDFADACVLWLYANTPRAQILTLDRRGFGVFRVTIGQQSKAMPKVIGLS